MGKINRKPRKKLIKTMDLLKPITLDMLGTEEDPCFGKHHDPKTSECARCGDCEICQIVMAQKLMLKRKEVEANGTFKDLEEKDMKLASPKLVRKKIRRRVKELAKLKPKGQLIDYIVDDIHGTYVMHGYTKTKIKKLILNLVDKSSNLSIVKDKIKFHAEN